MGPERLDKLRPPDAADDPLLADSARLVKRATELVERARALQNAQAVVVARILANHRQRK